MKISIPHPYFETIVVEKDGQYIGTPSREFWDAWRWHKSIKYKNDGKSLHCFREFWGMFKADPDDMDEILDMAEHGSSVSFVNSTQKDDYEARGAVWFIVNHEPIDEACKDVHEVCFDEKSSQTTTKVDER